MIQEIGQAYDNHYVACEAAGADYVLHYREGGLPGPRDLARWG